MHSIRSSISVVALVALMPVSMTATAQELDDAAGGGAATEASESESVEIVHEDSGTRPEHENRLAKESSPYLLQHAHNPVDWYPWGEEAFAKAKRENKLVFLSVGYAACHWCHVMERESFVDPEIAQKLNENFVCIKVDREERPDVDQIYMTAVQMINRNGGWPMSVFLLPDARPFWGGTYFPARDGDRGPSTGFLTIIDQIQNAWATRNDEVVRQSSLLTEAIAESQESEIDERPFDKGLINAAIDSLLEQYDPIHGGFGSPEGGPKFPEPSNLVFLLDRWQRDSVNKAQRDSAKRILLKSLNGMISGAMYDHLGGGFHRYSVDERWQIPHFEKMLYDNGQLVSVYAEAYDRTGNEEFRYVVESTCDFVLRELKADSGAFYSALDADSEGEEGKFYRWTKDDLVGFETVEGYRDFARIFRFNDQPNFEQEFYVPDPGRELMRVAEKDEIAFDALLAKLEPARNAMLSKRDGRKRPLTDTKILTAWNGLMISGLADAGRILDRKDYKLAAVKATRFLLRELRAEDGRLYRSHAAGEAKLNAYIDDYAFLVSALISLHRAMKDARLLTLATEMTDKQIELFWDDRQGGFFFTSSDHPELIVRVKDPVDSAVPSGVGVTAQNLIYLAEHAGREDYRDRLRSTLQSLTPTFRRAPFASPRATTVMAAFLDSEPQSETSD